MSPASAPVTNSKLYPAAVHEDQEAIAMTDGSERTVLACPPFSSPDPSTDAKKMLPLSDGTSAHQSALEAANVRDAAKVEAAPPEEGYSSLGMKELKNLAEERDLEIEGTGKNGAIKKDDYVKALNEDDASEMNAAEFKKLVAEAETQEDLDEIAELYTDSGKTYVTVEAAIDDRQDELNATAELNPAGESDSAGDNN
jgi:hypothetical protein